MNREEFERILSTLKPEDFDGHTEFHRLTPEQKLMWLSQIAQFVVEARTFRKISTEAPSPTATQHTSPA
ncbi:MAG: hypothetical protein RMI34_02980 [Chloroherpetonaceae bacterium]|nr:hypothetical protein [Chloroherpetonaceae bacterium]MDW8019021.1 hypothetical protein [Chloroherpetonaceae bacterium]